MGIDVEFQAVIPKIMTQDEVEKLYEEMQRLFYISSYVDKITIVQKDVMELYEDFNFKLPEGSTLLDFNSMCRLYTEGYERGELLPWINFAEYIEWKYEGAWVSYTGDCSWTIYPWTKEDREKLKIYYFKNKSKD